MTERAKVSESTTLKPVTAGMVTKVSNAMRNVGKATDKMSTVLYAAFTVCMTNPVELREKAFTLLFDALRKRNPHKRQPRASGLVRKYSNKLRGNVWKKGEPLGGVVARCGGWQDAKLTTAWNGAKTLNGFLDHLKVTAGNRTVAKTQQAEPRTVAQLFKTRPTNPKLIAQVENSTDGEDGVERSEWISGMLEQLDDPQSGHRWLSKKGAGSVKRVLLCAAADELKKAAS
jgi:hypothetical protein